VLPIELTNNLSTLSWN